MDINEKYKIAELVISYALDCGANQVAVYIKNTSGRYFEIREKKIDRLQESIGNSLSVDLYVDRKYSSHTTNLLKEKELFRFINEAVAATSYLSEDEFRYLPEKDLYFKGTVSDLGTLDPGLDSVDSGIKIDLARQAEEEVYGIDDRIISVTSYYTDNVNSIILADSNGFRGNSADSIAGLAADVSVRDDKGRPSDYWAEYSIFFNRLNKIGIGKKAFERALKKSNPHKATSGKYKIVVENRAAANLLNPFISALYGSSIYQKNSFLAGSINTKVAADILSFYDDPLMISGFGSRHFDNEGLRAEKREIVQQGILKNYFIDTYYGRKLNLAPTSGSSSNIVIKTGSLSFEDLVKTVDKGILITGFNGGNCTAPQVIFPMV